MNNQYLIWQHVTPKPSDAPILRRMWATVRKQPHNYEFRRKVARDYWLARCAENDPERAQLTARSVWPPYGDFQGSPGEG